MSDGVMFPEFIGSMKFYKSFKNIEFKEILRITKMMLGKASYMKFQLSKSVIEQYVESRGYYARIDLKNLLTDKEFDLKIQMTKEMVKNLKVLSSSSGDIAIYEDKSKANLLMFVNGHNGKVFANSFDAKLSPGPVNEIHTIFGVPVTISWNTLKQLIGKREDVGLVFYHDQLEALRVLDEGELFLSSEAFTKLSGKKPQATLWIHGFPEFAPTGQDVILSVVKAHDCAWLKIEWVLHLSKMASAFTMNMLVE